MAHKGAAQRSNHGSRAYGAGVFIGGSAGGIEALAELLSRLSPDLAAPVLVVLHVGTSGMSVLPAILDRVGSMHAFTPANGEALETGVIYVAPRGRHMLGGRACAAERGTDRARPATRDRSAVSQRGPDIWRPGDRRDRLGDARRRHRGAGRDPRARWLGTCSAACRGCFPEHAGERHRQCRRRLRAAGCRPGGAHRGARKLSDHPRRRAGPGAGTGARSLSLRGGRTRPARDAYRHNVPGVRRSFVGGAGAASDDVPLPLRARLLG
jgi:CheB methylesterase